MSDNPYSSPEADLVQRGGSGETTLITNVVMDHLRRTRGWVRFVGVLGIIGATFYLLWGIVMLVIGSSTGIDPITGSGSVPYMVGRTLGSIINILFGLLFFYPAMKLWKYGGFIKSLESSYSVRDLEEALNQQRAYWKFTGIMLIISLSLILIGILIVAGNM